jgi:hypothetical protein
MSTTFDDGKTNQPQTRQAAEWGLASLLLGGILAVLGLFMLQIDLHLFLSPPVWAPSDLRTLHNVAICGAFVLGGMGIASIAFGIRSLVFAYKRAQPSALGWAGLLISVLALLLWIGALADLFAVVDTMVRRQGMRGLF